MQTLDARVQILNADNMMLGTNIQMLGADHKVLDATIQKLETGFHVLVDSILGVKVLHSLAKQASQAAQDHTL